MRARRVGVISGALMGEQMLHRNYARRAIGLAVGAVLLRGSIIQATNVSWDGDGAGAPTGGSGTWSTTIANWTSDNGASYNPWVNNDTALIGGTAGTITISGLVQVNTASFLTNGYYLNG